MKNLGLKIVTLTVSIVIILFHWNIVNAVTSGPEYPNVVHLSQCGNLTRSNTTYILDNDVRSEGTCFTVEAGSIALDLNGHTILYDDYPNSGLPNPDFELGNGDTPSNWDLSQAPTAKRRPTAEVAMVNQWYLYLDNAPDGTKIISPWTYLPPNTTAVAYLIRGDVIWAYTQPPLWNIKVEYEDGSIVYSKDFIEDQEFEFTTNAIQGKYRLILTLVDGYGLVFGGYGRNPSIDLFDLRPAYNYGVGIDYGKDNIVIKNGRIVQGRGKSFLGHGITKPDGSNLTVTNISFENYGMEASAVSINWNSGVTIRDSNILNRSPYKLNRQQISAAIGVENSIGVLITNNVMDCGAAWGCIWTSKGNIEVSYNKLRTESVITNHHAITTYGSGNVLIHDNIIEADPGQGILFSMSTDGEIYNNTVTIKKTAPNFEYGYYQSDALTLKDYASKACKNLKVHDNIINIFGEYDKSYPAGGLLTGIMDGCTGGNVSYYNNKITARSIDPEVKISGINPGGRFDYEEVFYNNIIESDMYNILFGGYAGQGDAVSNIKFISNTLIKGPNPTNYHTFGQERGGQFTSDKTHFIDTRLLKGASLQDVQSGYYDYSYFADWHLNVSIKDQSGNPLPDVNITIKDKNDIVAFNGTTDQGGKIERIVLSEFKNTAGSFENFTPHTVTLSLPGGSQVAKEITMDRSKNLSYHVGGSIVISDVPVTEPPGPPGTVCNTPPRTPGPEVCNGIDDDCDGQIDNGIPDIVTGIDSGVCQPDVLKCVWGIWEAVQHRIGPVAEICDGQLDEDCDGGVDEGCICVNGESRSCGSDVGACQAGSQTCGNGQWGACAGEVMSSAEVCDGIDNDCDGAADEDFVSLGSTCSSGAGACAAEGVMVCSQDGTGTVCNARPGQPAAEVCNGIDDNCNGQADDGIGDIVTGVNVGVCQPQVERCTGGAFHVVQQGIGPAAEICDSQLDEDCDGIVNEDCSCVDGESRSCGSDVGACQAGSQTCENSRWGACEDEVTPAAEVCDGIDNDCDGATDEDFANLGSTCSAGAGACAAEGVMVCGQDGTGAVCNAVAGDPTPEICDGIDNDCDGSLDNDIILNDEDACTIETCVDGEVVYTSIAINDGDACTQDDCDPISGAITHDPVPVDDGGICTIDSCDPATGEITHVQDPGLSDLDQDGIADLCDGDMDGDQRPNDTDNCPALENSDQVDTDGDGPGDACDDDDDGDGRVDAEDNCPREVNPDQEDMDGDKVGDICDTDWDGDGVLNVSDNCYTTPNQDQANEDNDGLGDACDDDDDNDGIVDLYDNCPQIPNPNQEDAEKDGIGDICDEDDDNDTIPDAADNCPLVANLYQQDTDRDMAGDVCDNDLDGDTIINQEDNCPDVVNLDQRDTDGDRVGDACDVDDDNDGVEDAADNCPLITNIDQNDSDGDGKGDACDLMGDLNDDDKVDMSDYNLFRGTLGKCSGATGFIAHADYDRDGCVTLRDYIIWYGAYQKNK